MQALRASYFATVSYLDSLIGRVLHELEAQGLADDTLVIHTSGHGLNLGDHYIFGLFHMFEESLKVPLVMAGPGVGKGGRQRPVDRHATGLLRVASPSTEARDRSIAALTASVVVAFR